MMYLVDTNTIIYLVGGNYPALTRRVEATAIGDIRMSAIVFAELALGSENGLAPSIDMLERLIEQIPLMPFDEAAARAYAKMPFRRGRFDRLLAGHALSLGATVITRNLSDFADIPGLRVEDWTRAA
ncbi:type II toxin-antitoxin system VapC family toxin [Sphingomonas sp. H39-1-10]|nr:MULTISPECIES: type II toxin-antitoxin system VapC family toxin [Sphingomonas]MDF0489358.1 type II toxin-antitoxin system VapC family toxin [Sphingomonas pollutisoli]